MPETMFVVWNSPPFSEKRGQGSAGMQERLS